MRHFQDNFQEIPQEIPLVARHSATPAVARRCRDRQVIFGE